MLQPVGRFPLFNLVKGVRNKPACTTGLVIQCSNIAVICFQNVFLIGKQHIDGESYDVTRSHEVLGVLRNFIAKLLDEVFINVGHVSV